MLKYNRTLKIQNQLNKKENLGELWFEAKLNEANIAVVENASYQKNREVLRRYFGDFVFGDISVIVEIDGEYHDRKRQILVDQQRDEIIKTQTGFDTIRIPEFNDAIADSVIEEIKNRAKKITDKKNKLKAVYQKSIPVTSWRPYNKYRTRSKKKKLPGAPVNLNKVKIKNENGKVVKTRHLELADYYKRLAESQKAIKKAKKVERRKTWNKKAKPSKPRVIIIKRDDP